MGGRRRRALLALLTATVAVLAGCSPSPPKVVSVKGKVAFRGGQGVPNANVQFIPAPGQGDQGKQLIANATTGPDGSFQLKTYVNETGTALDGAVPGIYKVVVTSYRGGLKVSLKYATPKDSPLAVEVPETGNPNLTLELDPS